MEHKGVHSQSQPFAAAGDQFKDGPRSGAGGLSASISESVARGKEAIGTAASEVMNSAGSDLQSLRADLNSLKDTPDTPDAVIGGPMPRVALNLIDMHVGSRVRMRRLMLDLSQTDVADALGLTFQQVQKYEKGSHRISASRLQHLSQILQVGRGHPATSSPSTARRRHRLQQSTPGPTSSAFACDFAHGIITVVSLDTAYRSFRGGSGRLDTRLDTPPSIKRRHPDSCIAPLQVRTLAGLD